MLSISDNLSRVQERIAAAAEKAGRCVEEIQLIGVTKYVDSTTAESLFATGCQRLGESRPQELWQKAKDLTSNSIEWHLIGHLQTNKVRRTLPLVHLIHSVDSARLLAAIDQEAALLRQPARILLEINVSGDENKHGFTPDEAEVLLPGLSVYSNVKVAGLMAMAAWKSDAVSARRAFARLRELRDRWQKQVPDGIMLRELAMGMTGDFEEAILEGSTMVRIGSALFADAG